MLGFSQESSDDIILKRAIAASREVVWEAWTQPEQLIKWWGLKGYQNIFQEINIAQDGIWRYIMTNPDGKSINRKIIFNQIQSPNRIDYTFFIEGEKPVQFRTSVKFEPQSFQTEVIMRIHFKSRPERDMAITEHNIVEEAIQTLERLSTFISGQYERILK